MRVALYARVSSDEQAGADRVSLPAQLRVMRERCAAEGWDVVAVFEAPGESAWTSELAKRPRLLEAVEAAERGEFDVLMVHESSRFARSAVLALQVRARLERAGVVVLTASEPIAPSTADSRFVRTIDAGVQEWYSAKLSEHLRKAKAQQFEEGLHLGQPPFGYRRAGRRRPFEVVAEEAAAVREGFREYVAGASYTEIARRWNAMGLRPRSVSGHTVFTVPAMQTIFENRFYAGWVSHKGEWRRGAHEAIVSESLWEKAQLRVRRRGAKPKHRRLLSGVVSCSRCGGPLWLTNRKDRRYWYYRETSALRGEVCEAAGKMVNAEVVEREFEACVLSMTLDREWLRGVARSAHRPAKRLSKAEVRELEERKRRLSVAFVEGGLDEGTYRSRLREIEGVLSREREPVSLAGVRSAGERLWDIGQLWRSASDERKRELPRLLFEEVLVDVTVRGGACVWVRPWAEFEGYFGARAAVVGVGRNVGPPGFEVSNEPTASGLYLARALVA